MATAGGASIQDDEWFGEGSAFDSGEDLAAALFALAGAIPHGAMSSRRRRSSGRSSRSPTATPSSSRCSDRAPSTEPGGPDRRLAARGRASVSPAELVGPLTRASSCFLRRSRAGPAGRFATASPCCTEPRTRSRIFARRRWPWRSSPPPRHAAGDGPPRSSGDATRGSAAQRSYWRSRSSTSELVSDGAARRRAPWSECSCAGAEADPALPEGAASSSGLSAPSARAAASSRRRCRGSERGPGAAAPAPPRGRSRPGAASAAARADSSAAA